MGHRVAGSFLCKNGMEEYNAAIPKMWEFDAYVKPSSDGTEAIPKIDFIVDSDNEQKMLAALGAGPPESADLPALTRNTVSEPAVDTTQQLADNAELSRLEAAEKAARRAAK